MLCNQRLCGVWGFEVEVRYVVLSSPLGGKNKEGRGNYRRHDIGNDDMEKEVSRSDDASVWWLERTAETLVTVNDVPRGMAKW